MVFQPMLIRDIATRGVTVETRFPLHLDSLHEVRMTLGNVSIVLKGRVVHSRISDVDQDIVAYLSGLEFVEVPARSLEAIQEFLAGITADRLGG